MLWLVPSSSYLFPKLYLNKDKTLRLISSPCLSCPRWYLHGPPPPRSIPGLAAPFLCLRGTRLLGPGKDEGRDTVSITQNIWRKPKHFSMGQLVIHQKQNLIPALQIYSRKSCGWDKRGERYEAKSTACGPELKYKCIFEKTQAKLR